MHAKLWPEKLKESYERPRLRKVDNINMDPGSNSRRGSIMNIFDSNKDLFQMLVNVVINLCISKLQIIKKIHKNKSYFTYLDL